MTYSQPTIQRISQLTLTPNNRLARFLRRAEQDKLGEIVGAIPPILALATWLSQLHEALLFSSEQPLLLLNSNQEWLICRKIIADSEYGKALLQIETTAKTAQQAYQNLRAWNISTNILAADINNPDVQAFYEWTCY